MSPATKLYKERGITTLIFDFDGTLAVQTLDFTVMRHAALAVMAEYGFVPTNPMLPTMEQLTHASTMVPHEQYIQMRAAVLEAVKHVEIDAAHYSRLFPCVRPMFAACHSLGIATGIITRNCLEAVSTVFPDVKELCPCLLTRDDVTHVKPHPEHLQRALSFLQKKPAECLMIGDHPMDIEVGKAAGTQTAGVASGDYSIASLLQHNPDFCSKDIQEVISILHIL